MFDSTMIDAKWPGTLPSSTFVEPRKSLQLPQYRIRSHEMRHTGQLNNGRKPYALHIMSLSVYYCIDEDEANERSVSSRVRSFADHCR